MYVLRNYDFKDTNSNKSQPLSFSNKQPLVESTHLQDAPLEVFTEGERLLVERV